MRLGNNTARLGRVQLGAITGFTVPLSAVLPAFLDGQIRLVSVGPNAAPPFPDIRVYIAFEVAPGSITPNWTWLEGVVNAVSIRRGRSHELDRFEAGTCTVQLYNPQRDYDPVYEGSPHWPWVVPRRRIKVEATIDGIMYPMFAGFVESFQPSWTTFMGEITITASDSFEVFARQEINDTFPAERSDLRINRVLDDVGFTDTWWSLNHPQLAILGSTTNLAGSTDVARVLFPGDTEIMASTLQHEASLGHMQAVTQAENGRFFLRGDGTIMFLGRSVSDQEVPYKAVFGDRAGETIYDSISPEYSARTMYNEVRVTRQGGIEQIVEDTGSIAQYLRTTLSRPGMLMSTDVDAEASAGWLLSHYHLPLYRINAMAMSGRSAWGTWRQILGREIGDQILLRRRPRPDGSTPIEQKSVIEGVSHDIEAGQVWTTSFQLSPVFVQHRWLLNDPVDAVLGSTTTTSY